MNLVTSMSSGIVREESGKDVSAFAGHGQYQEWYDHGHRKHVAFEIVGRCRDHDPHDCLLYTSDAADE